MLKLLIASPSAKLNVLQRFEDIQFSWDRVLYIIYTPNVMFCTANFEGNYLQSYCNFFRCNGTATGYLSEGECTSKTATDDNFSQSNWNTFDQIWATYELAVNALNTKR